MVARARPHVPRQQSVCACNVAPRIPETAANGLEQMTELQVSELSPCRRAFGGQAVLWVARASVCAVSPFCPDQPLAASLTIAPAACAPGATANMTKA